MAQQISNKELAYYFINEVFRLDRRKYLFTYFNLRTRKKYIPSLKETCNYINIGEEFVKRLEAEFDGYDIKQRRANYYFFRERFQRAYAEILGIPSNLLENIKFKEEGLEKQLNGYFSNNIALLPHSQLSLVIKYCYINLKYMTKVIWIEGKEINGEEEFVKLLHNKMSFALGVTIRELLDIDKSYKILKNNFIFLVFNNCGIAVKFQYYNELKKFIQSSHGNPSCYLKLIEIFVEKKSG